MENITMKVALIFSDGPEDQASVDFALMDATDMDRPMTPAFLTAVTLHRAAKTGIAARLLPLLLPDLYRALGGEITEAELAECDPDTAPEVSDEALRALVNEQYEEGRASYAAA